MNKNLKLVLVVLDIAGLAISSIWYYKSRELEPLLAVVACISGLIGLIFTKETKNKRDPKPSLSQRQKSGENSTNYQAGRDIKL